MAWTSPRTWVTNEIPTASIFNTHVRDNLNALRSASLGTSASATGTSTQYPAFTASFDDFAASAGWGPGTTYWTVPWTGRFEVMATATWSGATGTPTVFYVTAERWNSTRTVLLDTIAYQDGASLLNSKACIAGLFAPSAGDCLLIGCACGATGSAGSVVVRASIHAVG